MRGRDARRNLLRNGLDIGCSREPRLTRREVSHSLTVDGVASSLEEKTPDVVVVKN